jgi:glucose-fructose oxidoreductase
MTAYRLHFHPGYLAAMEAIRDGSIGEPRYFTSQFSMQLRTPNIRAEEETGGGPTYDLGTYCVNAARHVFRAEPIEVYAQLRRGRDRRFDGVEETAQVALRFPGDKLASFTCSFGAGDASAFQVVGTKGIVRLQNAYEMVGSKTLRVEGAGGRRTREFADVDQFAPLLLAFSDAVIAGRAPQPSGDEGAADIRVNEAILLSGRRGKPIALPARRFAGATPGRRRAMRIPPHREPELVGAEGPSKD